MVQWWWKSTEVVDDDVPDPSRADETCSNDGPIGTKHLPVQSPGNRRKWFQLSSRKKHPDNEYPSNSTVDTYSESQNSSKVALETTPVSFTAYTGSSATLSPSVLALGTTLAASFIGSTLTYPAEQWRMSWEQTALQRWNFDATAQVRSNRALIPFVRLWTNHLASTSLESMAAPIQDDSYAVSTACLLYTSPSPRD